MNFEFVEKPEDALKQQEEFDEPVIVERTIGDHTDYDVWDFVDINDMMLDGDIRNYNDFLLQYFPKNKKCTVAIWIANYNEETKTFQRKYDFNLAYASGTYRKGIFNGKIKI
jgi:hypothetical protein